MELLVFWFVYPFLWLISRLPFWLFYKISDLVFILVYHIIGYRKKIVTENLELVFPEKSSEEINTITRKFYRHMCDMFLEMIKSISISNNQLKQRFTFTNLEEIERIRKMDKSIIVMCGHYASYEWANSIQLYGIDYKGFGIYKKIKNKYFDKLAKDIRARFDAELISSRETITKIIRNQREGIPGIYFMVADQSPKLSNAKFWTEFMGSTVPVFMGAEKLAAKLDIAVVYLQVEKLKRGYYQATFITISDNPKEEPAFKITGSYLTELEKQIRKAPEYYLWTHKRWKHRNAPIPKDAVIFKTRKI
jgi:KDO2-lipid IV(A) lauroyltransferase